MAKTPSAPNGYLDTRGRGGRYALATHALSPGLALKAPFVAAGKIEPFKMTTTTTTEKMARLPAEKEDDPVGVSCGGHRATSCAECPRGNGKSWCNGDCAWFDDKGKCMTKAETALCNGLSVLNGMPRTNYQAMVDEGFIKSALSEGAPSTAE
ncbi:hypothetical protein EMIHUDRAFT_212605 [Emiliania huxleyi CCMP1516]|uniref:PSI domain-containing protein n=2 Tax=Emiliania huxleyi TaxID=2903 RepID=A0A0D3IQH4_EMIH1|nr:hypothetical protein EMIHUDRAFT_212605 [Emiliania huxleyi CCMP1516]EOD13509.1 hypothetical protein EMIHUDRAFT_212605 [Emiliania huxleyi CCMP1516]|eukprot:XP_005765938.1 hypothetical protein EMIHUDRAFT_212605 [Emiliania huxleyi CCMP1516]